MGGGRGDAALYLRKGGLRAVVPLTALADLAPPAVAVPAKLIA